MKVLITGGTGFLGKNLQSIIKQDNWDVTYTTSKTHIASKHNTLYTHLNLLDQFSTKAIFNMVQPDVIIHMAAVCGGIGANQLQPADFIQQNSHMSLNVFTAANSLNKKPKIYSLGSVCAYASECPVPFKEDDMWSGMPHISNAPYGESKRLLQMLHYSYRKQYGIGGAFLIPVNMYGRFDSFDPITSHVIPALIRKFVEAKESNSDAVTIWGTGKATREFLYAEDCAKAIVMAVEKNLDTDLPINIGTGKDISMHDLAKKIAFLTGFNGKIVYDTSKPDGQMKRCLDVSRAKELLGFTADTAFDAGLCKTIDWFLQNR